MLFVGVLIFVLMGFLPNILSASFAAPDKPNVPGEALSTIEDHSSLATAKEKTTSDDTLYLNLLERPFTAEEMKYLGFIDISLAELSKDGQWMYVVISVEEALPPGPVCFFGVEIDVDLDDRGDLLIWATLPKDDEWASDSKIFFDKNDDVGGLMPYIAEPPDASWDGYDSNLPEGVAWIRRAPEDNQQVWLAFPTALLEGAKVFIWNVYAQAVPKGTQSSLHMVSSSQQEQALVFDQTKFHYNDFVHPSKAGSPIAESRFYPLEALSLVDNTCRQVFGGRLEQPRPGFCNYKIQQVVTPAEPAEPDEPDAPTQPEPLDDVIYPGEKEDPSPDPKPTPEEECQDSVAKLCDDGQDDGQYNENENVGFHLTEEGRSVAGEGDQQGSGQGEQTGAGEGGDGLEPFYWDITDHYDNFGVVVEDE